MPKTKILTGKELIMNMLKYAIFIFIITGIIDIIAVIILTIGLSDLIISIFKFILIFILIWFSLKRIDKLNKFFNKYTLAMGIIIFYVLLNSIINYILINQFNFALGIISIIITLLVAKFIKLNNHKSDIDLLMRS